MLVHRMFLEQEMAAQKWSLSRNTHSKSTGLKVHSFWHLEMWNEGNCSSQEKPPKRKRKLQERIIEGKSLWRLQKARSNATRQGETLLDPPKEWETFGASLCLRYWDRWTFRVVKSIHGVQLHDHVQAVDENEQQDQQGQQGHPNSWSEETSTVAGVGEICAVGQSKALNLHHKRTSMKHNQDKKPQFKKRDRIIRHAY